MDTLLLPLAAPWSKASEVIDYVREARPRQAVPVHDAVLSPAGFAVHTRLVGPDGPGTGAELRVLGEGRAWSWADGTARAAGGRPLVPAVRAPVA